MTVDTEKFKDTLNMKEKNLEWINQLEVLSKIAAVEPQVTYYAFAGDFKYKVTCKIRTISNICKHLEKLD